MRKMLFMLGMAAFAFGLSPGAFCLDVPLKFEKLTNNQDMNFPYGFGRADAAAVKPNSGWKLPKLTTDKPYNVLLSLGDKQHLLVFDKKKAEDKAYTRLWFDTNGNNDLTDEMPIDGTSQNMGDVADGNFSIQFSSVDVWITVDGAKLPYCIQPVLYGYAGSNGEVSVNFSYTVICAYSGTFRVGGAEYTMWIGDRNGNGRFGDTPKILNSQMPDRRSPLYADGDVMYISDGKALSFYDSQTLGDLLLVNDTLFRVTLDIPKRKMVLTEIKSGLSPLKLAAKPERLTLLTEDNKHCLMVFKPTGDVIQLPSGNYHVLYYEISRKDPQGDMWRLIAGGSAESPVVTVKPNGGAILAIGEPFIPLITLPQTGRTSASLGNLPLSFNIEGQGREIMTNLIHEGTATRIPLSKNRKERPKEPSYTIVKNDGEIVAKGSFEYG